MREHHERLFACEICGTRYDQAEQARRCEAAEEPAPRFHPGDQVMLVDGDYQPQFPDTVFTVRRAQVTLDRPALLVWEAGQPADHMVVYVLEGDEGFRLTFVPEHHVGPAGAPAEAEVSG